MAPSSCGSSLQSPCGGKLMFAQWDDVLNKLQTRNQNNLAVVMSPVSAEWVSCRPGENSVYCGGAVTMTTRAVPLCSLICSSCNRVPQFWHRSTQYYVLRRAWSISYNKTACQWIFSILKSSLAKHPKRWRYLVETLLQQSVSSKQALITRRKG